MERFSGCLALLALLGSVAPRVRAQVVGAGVVVLSSKHEPLGSPLVGGQIIVGQHVADSPFFLQMRGTILRGHGARDGAGRGVRAPVCRAVTNSGTGHGD